MSTLKQYAGICTVAAALLALPACNGNNGPANPANIHSDTTYRRGNTQNISRGQELFEQKCEVCHGVRGAYRNNNAADLQVSIIDSLTIINTIKNGKNPMPMFGNVFSDSDLAQLEMYVKSLRK